MASITIRIKPNGEIDAETLGIKGKECLSYIEVLEQLLDAETVESSLTAEYYETVGLPVEERIEREE